jgi:hypothetical protein
MSSKTHIQQYLQEKTNNQYLWWWLGKKKMISVHPLFGRAPVSISAKESTTHTEQHSSEIKWNAAIIINWYCLTNLNTCKISQEAKMESKIGAVHKVSGLSRATFQNLSRFEVRERHYWAIQVFQGTTCLKVCAFVARLWWVHSTLESSFESKDSQMEPMLWKKFQSVTLNPCSNHAAMGVKNPRPQQQKFEGSDKNPGSPQAA